MTAQEQTSQGVAWIALGISIIALVFSFLAWNRDDDTVTRNDIDTTPVADQEEVIVDNDNDDAFEIAAMRTTAAAELAALRARLAADRSYDTALEETQNARQQLAASYATASTEAQAEWNELETYFDQLEDQLRDKSADALDTLSSIVTTLEKDLRTDND